MEIRKFTFMTIDSSFAIACTFNQEHCSILDPFIYASNVQILKKLINSYKKLITNYAHTLPPCESG